MAEGSGILQEKMAKRGYRHNNASTRSKKQWKCGKKKVKISKTARNRRRRKTYKGSKKPNRLEKMNGFVLVLNYADSFRCSHFRNPSSIFFSNKWVRFGPNLSIPSLLLKRQRIFHKRRRCLGFVVHSFSPAFYDEARGVTQIQGRKYAQHKNLVLPLPKSKKLLRMMGRYWYSMKRNMTNKQLWNFEGKKHGVYYQCVGKGSYWKVVMKLAMRYLGRKSATNLIKHIWKKGFRLDHEYNCNEFEAFLSEKIGARVKVTFEKDGNTWYLNEVHILFDLNFNLVSFPVKKHLINHTENTRFVLESYINRRV